MKGTDFYEVGKHIKQMEIAELKEALKAHGGSYIWYDTEQDENSDDYIPVYEVDDIPIVMVNHEHSGPTDVYICKAWINKYGDVEIEALEKEYATEIDVNIDDIAIGHTYYLTMYMKDIEGVEISGKNHLYALEDGKVKCLTAPNEVTKVPLSDLLDAIPFVEIMFEFKGETYVRRIHTQLIDQGHYEDILDWWTGAALPDGTKITFEILADKDENGGFTVNNMQINVYENDDDDILETITDIRYRTSEEESFKTIK